MGKKTDDLPLPKVRSTNSQVRTGGGKATAKIVATYVNDTDFRRLKELEPYVLTERERESEMKLTNSELIKRVVWLCHKMVVKDGKKGQAPIQDNH